MTGAAKGHYRKATGDPMTAENNRYQPSEAAMLARPEPLPAESGEEYDDRLMAWAYTRCPACQGHGKTLSPSAAAEGFSIWTEATRL